MLRIELSQSRWERWDKYLEEGLHLKLLEEYDILDSKFSREMTFGDIRRKEEAMRALDILPFRKKFEKIY